MLVGRPSDRRERAGEGICGAEGDRLPGKKRQGVELLHLIKCFLPYGLF